MVFQLNSLHFNLIINNYYSSHGISFILGMLIFLLCISTSTLTLFSTQYSNLILDLSTSLLTFQRYPQHFCLIFNISTLFSTCYFNFIFYILTVFPSWHFNFILSILTLFSTCQMKNFPALFCPQHTSVKNTLLSPKLFNKCSVHYQ